MSVYYNEFDPFAAAWLRELINEGLIAHGVVDERSIVDVRPDDLRGFAQCHFFAGIGGWPYALRLAGWSDDRPVWTGSCPCQPLSSAGLRLGHADERHLWPAFHRLIAECRPATVFGEQVASKDGREWFSAVRADLEADGYACGGADLCAAGIGAPHIRQRLWWVARRLENADRSLRGQGQDPFKRLAQGHAVNLTDQITLAGWGTPNASAPGGTPEQALARKEGLPCGQSVTTLDHQVQLAGWSTPTVAERDRSPEIIEKLAKKRLEEHGQTTVPLYLTEQAQLAGWPTPTVGNADGSQMAKDASATGRRPDGSKATVSLNHVASLAGPARLTASGEMLTGSTAGMESGGQLSPKHSLWLMGFPTEWVSCGVRVTRSSRKSQQRSSNP